MGLLARESKILETVEIQNGTAKKNNVNVMPKQKSKQNHAIALVMRDGLRSACSKLRRGTSRLKISSVAFPFRKCHNIDDAVEEQKILSLIQCELVDHKTLKTAVSLSKSASEREESNGTKDTMDNSSPGDEVATVTSVQSTLGFSVSVEKEQTTIRRMASMFSQYISFQIEKISLGCCRGPGDGAMENIAHDDLVVDFFPADDVICDQKREDDNSDQACVTANRKAIDVANQNNPVLPKIGDRSSDDEVILPN